MVNEGDFMNKELLQKFTNIALSQVGVKEEGGNNKGAKIVEYQRTTWLKPDMWPWCSAFVCWCMNEWLKDSEVKTYLKLHDDKDVNKFRCQDASAFGWEKWGKEHGLQILSEVKKAEMGDIVVFDFSHVGIVVSDQEYIADPIETVEGNTNGKGQRDSVNGDGVWKKFRPSSLTKCYIRFV